MLPSFAAGAMLVYEWTQIQTETQLLMYAMLCLVIGVVFGSVIVHLTAAAEAKEDVRKEPEGNVAMPSAAPQAIEPPQISPARPLAEVSSIPLPPETKGEPNLLDFAPHLESKAAAAGQAPDELNAPGAINMELFADIVSAGTMPAAGPSGNGNVTTVRSQSLATSGSREKVVDEKVEKAQKVVARLEAEVAKAEIVAAKLETEIARAEPTIAKVESVAEAANVKSGSESVAFAILSEPIDPNAEPAPQSDASQDGVVKPLPELQTVAQWLQYAQKMISEHNYDVAIKCYDKVAALDSSNFDSLYLKSIALRKIGHCQDAIYCINFALSLNGKDARALTEKGECLIELSKSESALTWFEKAIASDAAFAKAWLGKARCLASMAKHKEAIQCYEKVLSLEPDNEIAKQAKTESVKKIKVSH